MKKLVCFIFLLALSLGDSSYFFGGTGVWNARWDGCDKRYGNWISAEGSGRNGVCQQGVGIFETDANLWKNGLKALYRNNTGQTLVLTPCEVVP